MLRLDDNDTHAPVHINIKCERRYVCVCRPFPNLRTRKYDVYRYTYTCVVHTVHPYYVTQIDGNAQRILSIWRNVQQSFVFGLIAFDKWNNGAERKSILTTKIYSIKTTEMKIYFNWNPLRIASTNISKPNDKCSLICSSCQCILFICNWIE